jgi:hypothetical protein
VKFMNRTAVIASLGCLALIGTGFAAWTYATKTDTKTVQEAAAVAEVAHDGNINVTAQDLKFVLDEDVANETGTLKVGKLTWSGSLVFGWNTTIKTASKVTYTVVVTIPDGINTYVKISDANTKTYTYENKALSDTITFDTADFAPVQAQMPQTETAYNTMVSAFGTKTISFVISAAIVDA